MESSQEDEEKNKRRRGCCRSNSTTILGCPNCIAGCLDSTTAINQDLCELCLRLHGETVDYSSTTIKNKNKKPTVINDNKCPNYNINNKNYNWCNSDNNKKMIRHSCSWLSFYQLGTYTCASTVVRWNFYHKKISWINLLWIAIILFSLPATSNGLSDHLVIPNPNSTQVCQSIDIRNSVSQFEKLKGCRVIEGFLQILLINHANDTAYANLTFPDLVEITGYLLLYRVNGLKSFGKLFPNLAIIRGHFLFINYALVVFEMMHLQELAFYSLTHIARGAVRFANNPSLCYVNTIDWDIIAPSGKGEHVISGNRPRNGCPVCEKSCPREPSRPEEYLCWNKHRCQKLCYKTCGEKACADSGECCHSSCVGGCDGETEYDCRACKTVTINETRCVDKCPPGTYSFMNRRCILENECSKMQKPLEAFGIAKAFPYKVFNNTCIIECPAGYMEEEINGKPSCKKCDGVCLKECSGANVDSIASAQKLRGCTHIRGSLEIQIRGGRNMVKELEENLNMIEQIDGYLKVVRSFSLLSLNFLKNLKAINGNDLDNNKYSLTVLDNHNLQELWDWETHPPIKIKSKNGLIKVFFHHNPKLCLHKIESLREISGLPEFKEADVALISNGDKVACNVTELKAKVVKKTSEVALIEWDAFQHHDPRSLLGYVVYFIEAPHQNVTMYDGRDACGGDGWRVDDIAADGSHASNNNGGKSVNALLTQLKPYTQYAFYIKTYTIATEKYGAQSKIHYFTTLPGTPSPVRAVDIRANSSSELVITWKVPARKNGNITFYRLFIKYESDDGLDDRNYCVELPQRTEKKLPPLNFNDNVNEKDTKLSQPINCNCGDRETNHLLREKEATSAIAFEDALHNQVYVKKIDSSNRKKREISMTDNIYTNMTLAESGDTLKYTNSNESFEIIIPASNTSYFLQNLKHYAVYSIELQACREEILNDLSDACSPKTMRTARTKPNPNADVIPPGSFKVSKLRGNNSRLLVKLQWDEPVAPNGIILTYQIEYKRVDILDAQPITPICITRKDFVDSKKTYIIRELPSGNYSIKVRAVSLSGNGDDSEIQFIYIEELSGSGFWIIFSSIFSIIFLILLLIGLYLYKRQLICNDTSRRLIATVNPEYVSSVYVPDEWEVARKKIRLLKELGNGSFGMVYEGYIKDLKSKPEIRCAVKTVNENATDRERIEFLNEASVMKAFNTHHVVRLLGVVSRGQPTLVVMELMVNGDLKTYLRSHRPDQCENMNRQPPTLKRIIRMAAEIADGMAYLSAKKFVHRDLAARNCMVAEDLTVKIGDFGMTRDIYETDYYRKGTKGLLPVRWMAPESLKDGVFTTYSDVWSYGVVLWEMVTLASQPYQGLSNDQVLRYVIDGGVMERPENCPDSLYILMRRTWNQKVVRRPTFIDIATIILRENTLEGFENVSFYHCPEGIEARNQNISNSPQNDKDFELETLDDLREDQVEGSEDSPLRGDFEDFANIEQNYLKNNSVDSRFNIHEPYGENSKISTIFHDLNSSKIPLKAGFDDFDGVSGGSLCSSKDTLDFPFVEDSLKSVKNSPSIRNNNTPLRNISPLSGKNTTQSPHNKKLNDILLRNRGQNKSQKNSPDYENRTPELISTIEGKDIVSMRIDFSSLDNKDIDSAIDETDKPQSVTEKTENLNNGYIGGTTTTT